MKASELINRLEVLITNYGDLPVVYYDRDERVTCYEEIENVQKTSCYLEGNPGRRDVKVFEIL